MEEKKSKPIFKRVWFWILVIVIIGGLGSVLGGKSGNKTSQTVKEAETKEKPAEKKIEYTPVTVEEMFEALDNNAAAASDKYKGKYVSVTGRLSNIDSDGNYINLTVLDENDYEHMFSNAQCFIKNDEQLQVVKGMSTGQTVVVNGKVKDVGEVLGYSIDIDSLAAK